MALRTFLIAALLVGLGVASLPAEAQSPKKVFRIGFLANTVPLADLVARVPSHPAPIVIEEELKKLGWVDGKNIEFVWKSAEGRYDRMPALAEDLVRQQVDVILTFGGAMYDAAAKTSTIPIVMVTMGDPVDGVRVKSFARPGGNITGLTVAIGSGLLLKRLALLKSAIPSATRVAVVRQFPGPLPKVRSTFKAETIDAATALGLSLVYVDHVEPDMPAVFEQAVRQSANAVLFPETPHLYWPRQQELIGELAIRHRLPVMHTMLPSGELGGILTYASDIMDNYRRAPYYIDRILRGANPGDLPIEQPSRFQLIVNLKAAKAMGLTIPQSVLLQADRVIE